MSGFRKARGERQEALDSFFVVIPLPAFDTDTDFDSDSDIDPDLDPEH